MTDIAGDASPAGTLFPAGAGAFWKKDDWWAVAVGLGLVALAYAAYASGSSLGWLAVAPVKWTTFAQLTTHFAGSWQRYVAQCVLWLVVTAVPLAALGHRPRDTVPAFLFLYVVSVAIFALGQWARAVTYNLEPPLVALAVGLLIANTNLVPRWFDAGFRVEYYIKLGVVLLGATLPFTLIIWAGPVALLQASIVSIVTFLVIFGVARALGIERRFAATLGVGGAVCGVSAAIAISAAVGARKRDAAAVIAIVILWAIVMIFALPVASGALGLSAGLGSVRPNSPTRPASPRRKPMAASRPRSRDPPPWTRPSRPSP
jgi:hypothetical protein